MNKHGWTGERQGIVKIKKPLGTNTRGLDRQGMKQYGRLTISRSISLWGILFQGWCRSPGYHRGLGLFTTLCSAPQSCQAAHVPTGSFAPGITSSCDSVPNRQGEWGGNHPGRVVLVLENIPTSVCTVFLLDPMGQD